MPQTLQEFTEMIARMRISGEVGCPECGGPLEDTKSTRKKCFNCGQEWPLYKLDEFSADEAFDSQEALNRLISDAREITGI